MNRSPLFYPLNRGMDADAGGAADLQTDVMRFMAIISMCLVAIFALVQSIPLAPVPATPTAADPAPEPVIEPMKPVPPPEETVVLTRPAPASPPPAPEPIVLDRPRFTPAAKPSPAPMTLPEPASDPKPAVSAVKAQEGFTLRFESDEALTRLVEQHVVGLYVIAADRTDRMDVAADAVSFWSASTPQRFHEMDARTVPAAVVSAYRRQNPAAGGAVKWGVALPAGMSRQLSQFLSEQSGGALIIGLDGELRLEQ